MEYRLHNIVQEVYWLASIIVNRVVTEYQEYI